MTSTQINKFRMQLECDWMTPESPCFRPLEWPPRSDWIVSTNRHGEILSRWCDDTWDFTPWARKSFKLNFTAYTNAGKTTTLNSDNTELLKRATAWLIWRGGSIRATGTLEWRFLCLKRIFAFCQKNNIRADRLNRHRALLSEIPNLINKSNFNKLVSVLHKLWLDRDEIGFELIDEETLRTYKSNAPDHEIIQTAYIPPRIWSYQARRLREILDDYLIHKDELKACFDYCIAAYEKNYGPLQSIYEDRSGKRLAKGRNPFTKHPKNRSENSEICRLGAFKSTARKFGIHHLLEMYVIEQNAEWNVRHLTTYFSLVQYAGLAYIANFTLQRIDEVCSLRTDCLAWESDPKLGEVAIIRGETTKTIKDSDARWPTSPSVQIAVQALSHISKMRIKCAAADHRVSPTSYDINNPFIFDRAFEPWIGSGITGQPYETRMNISAYKQLIYRFPRLFNIEELKIREEDLAIARMLTPNLNESDGFQVGQTWPLSWHQLRRTGAVNMFSSGLISDSSMQYLMKHSSRHMPLYYGRGFSKLNINKEVSSLLANTMQEMMAQKILSMPEGHFISPHGTKTKEAMIVKLISGKNISALSSAGRRGDISFRSIRLGACTKTGHCEYGGIESVARCAGGDGKEACADVLYDLRNREKVISSLSSLRIKLNNTAIGSRSFSACSAEINALENYLKSIGEPNVC